MRRFLNALFALAVFSAASSGLCTLPGGFYRPCATANSGQGPKAALLDSAMPCCCCGPQDSQIQGEGSCPSNAPKCGTTPSASLQLGLAQEREKFKSAEISAGANHPSEPKPWPPSFAYAWLSEVDSPDVPTLALFGARPSSRGDAWEQGGGTLDRLSRLSVFRI